jgi:ketosteroid isomerase-like protein
MSDDRDHALAVATRAFDHFRHGLATGEWQPWFDDLASDFVFWFPQGRFKGRHEGKAKALEFFSMVSTVYREGLLVDEVESVTANDTTVVFLFRDHGRMTLNGVTSDYRNRVAIALDVHGEHVVAYREYFGADGTWS